MAKIKVGSGFGKTSIGKALLRVQPGDMLVLDPGHYDFGNLTLNGIAIYGNASADEVTVEGSFTVVGHCLFTNLTIQAMPYKNAIHINSNTSTATVTGCTVYGEVGAKFPTIWCTGGTLNLEGVNTHSEADAESVTVLAGGTLHAVSSHLDTLGVNAATVNLRHSSTKFLRAHNHARVNTFGTHRCDSLAGQRVFTISGRSVCIFETIALGPDYEEGHAKDSIVQIGNVLQEVGGSFKILTEDGARVKTMSAQVEVADREEALEPPAPTGPKIVEWALEDAHEFQSKIASQLAVGDTVRLQAGDYFLEDYDVLFLNAHLQGAGQELTRIHGAISAMADGKAVIRDLTVCAVQPNSSAIEAHQSGAHLTAEHVTLRPAPGTTVPVVNCVEGQIVLNNCTVEALPNDRDHGQVLVQSNGRITATGSKLGWVLVEKGAQATLAHCTSHQLSAESGADITVLDEHHILENECDQYGVEARTGGTIDMPALTTSAEQLMVCLDGGEIILANFAAENGGNFVLDQVHGELVGIDRAYYDLYQQDDNGDWQLIPHHEHSTAAQAQAELGTEYGQDQLSEQDFEVVQEPEEASTHTPVQTPHSDGTGPLFELAQLVGLTRVKEQVQGFVNAVRLSQMREELGLPSDEGFTLHSMFLGGPGTGKTTVARLIGTAMHQAGVVENDSFLEIGRAELISDNIGGTAKQTKALLERGRGGVIFIDEAYSLASEDSAGFAGEAIAEILTFMEDHRGDTMVILAGYNDKMHDLLAVNEGLKSRIKHRFDFEDYSPAEIAKIGLSELARGQYSVDQELYSRIIGPAYAQSADRSNARWVRNFNQDLRTIQGRRVIEIANPTRADLSTIADSDLHALVGGDPETRKSKLVEKLAELDAMIGLAPVKAWVRTLVEQATVNQRMIEFDGTVERPNYHVAFTGNPGTGKTTVARIIAEIFYTLGILSSPTVKSVAASELIGKFLGHSTDNTIRAFDAALGGVIFIDEAHQLRTRGSSNSELRQEVINVMINRLEDDRDKFVAVFAGYTDEMHEFYVSDPGLKSRIPNEIEFPDYTPAEVAQIATALLAKYWTFDHEFFAEFAARTYEALPPSEQNNGRWARTFTEQVITRQNRYLVEHDVHGAQMKHITNEVLRGL